MKGLRRTLSIIVAALMLFGCMPSLALGSSSPAEPASETQKAPAQQDEVPELTAKVVKPESEKGDVFYDPPYMISLTEAANPAYALNMVEVTTQNNEWGVAYDEDMERTVAYASIPTAAGSYERTLHTAELTVDDGHSPYILFKAKLGADQTIEVVCTDIDRDESWSLELRSSYTVDSWNGFSAEIFDAYTQSFYGERRIRLDIISSFMVSSSKGGGEDGFTCMLTDLGVLESDIDSALNAPDSDLHFEKTADCMNNSSTFTITYVQSDRLAYGMRGRNDDCILAFTTHITAAQGDVLSFDFVSDLDYMNGAAFFFGTGSTYADMNVLFTGDEAGNGDYWSNDWDSWSYTIPANGEYDFVWAFCGTECPSSYVYIDNVRVTPRMSPERALNENGETATYKNGGDTPWVPCYFKNEFCMKSGACGHGGTSTLISEGNLLKAGDMVEFRLFVSSEKDYDYFNAYALNTTTGVETELAEESGIFNGWVAYGALIQTDGVYTIRFVYSKDGSVSQGDDCVYLDAVGIPTMTQTHAACATEDDEESIHAWDYYPENFYRFVPVLFNGEVVLASNNRGVASSTASVYFTVDINAFDTFAFDYIKDAEANYDNLTVYINDVEDTVIKARSTDWQKYSFTPAETGSYTFCLSFKKDGSVNTGTDTVYLRNARLETDELNQAVLQEYSGIDKLHHVADYGSYFTTDTVDGRYVGVYSTEEGYAGQAAFEHYQYQNGFDYIKFDYKIVGTAALSFIVNGETDTVFAEDTEGEWQTFYYRIPISGEWRFRLLADASGGAVYVDEFFAGKFTMDLNAAIASPEGDAASAVTIDWDDTEGFIGVEDPLEPNGHTPYGYCAYDGNIGCLAFDRYMEPGDRMRIAFAFLDEDGEPNGSAFVIYINGEAAVYCYDDDILLNRFYMYNPTAYAAGTYHYEILYYPGEEVAGGDGFAVLDAYRIPIGVTLDEALNVEGGDIHFTDPDGQLTFLPVVDAERAYAVPVPGVYPEDPFEVRWGFEDESELSNWVMVDSDGDGYGWGYFDSTSSPVYINTEFGTGVLKSDSYLPVNGATPLTPDNWALTPEIEVPEDAHTVDIGFVFAGANTSWYAEHFGLYVGTGTDVSTYTLLFDMDVESSGWQSVATDVSGYEGQTIRFAIRHYNSDDVYALMIDELWVGAIQMKAAQVGFELDINDGDTLNFEVMSLTDDPSYLSGVYLALYQDGVVCWALNGYDFVTQYGGENWVGFSTELYGSGDTSYYFVECCTNEDGHGLYLYLDNVEQVHRQQGLIGDVNCDGFVTFSDVAALYNYIVGGDEITDQGRINADVNGDGTINFADVAALYNFILGSGD